MFSFSFTALCLCLIAGEPAAVVRVYRLPPPLNLQTLCVQAVRAHLSEAQICALPLPSRMRDMLMLRPIYRCSSVDALLV